VNEQRVEADAIQEVCNVRFFTRKGRWRERLVGLPGVHREAASVCSGNQGGITENKRQERTDSLRVLRHTVEALVAQEVIPLIDPHQLD
jgi:hypothetical protein